MPHEALLSKWLQVGSSGSPADDAAALAFIRTTWGHRGYDAWERGVDDRFPAFTLIAEGEPRTLMVGYLRFSADPDPFPSRRGAMAMLLALENLLKRERRDLGVLIAGDERQARRLAPVLPSLELLVDCTASADAPAPLTAKTRTPWPASRDESRSIHALAGELARLLKL